MFFGKGKVVVSLVDEHIEAVKSCILEYVTAMDDMLEQKDESVRKMHTVKMQKLETEADTIRHLIIREMLNGGLLVDSRKSLMHIIEYTDKVAGVAEDVIEMMYQEQLEVPEYMIKPIKEMNAITKEQLALLCETVRQVIYKYNIDELYRIIRQIEDLESDVDTIQKQLLHDLFRSDMSLANKLQLKQLINEIGSMSDLIEDVSDEVEIVMLTRKV